MSYFRFFFNFFTILVIFAQTQVIRNLRNKSDSYLDQAQKEKILYHESEDANYELSQEIKDVQAQIMLEQLREHDLIGRLKLTTSFLESAIANSPNSKSSLKTWINQNRKYQ